MGAAKLGGDGDEGIVSINITPFVDIILVVLIIFMVTTSYIVKQAIKVQLPEAATGESTEGASLGIMLTQDLELRLDGEPITQDGLRAAIRDQRQQLQAQGQDPDSLVCLIAADKTVPHGEVIGVIDLIRQEGVAKFAFNIDPVPPPTEAAGAVPPLPTGAPD